MPYVEVYIDEDVVLKKLSDDDLKKELDRRKCAPLSADESDLSHVKHLADCGLLSAAQSEALHVVGRAIGRPIH